MKKILCFIIILLGILILNLTKIQVWINVSAIVIAAASLYIIFLVFVIGDEGDPFI